jgi:hypothetical protein
MKWNWLGFKMLAAVAFLMGLPLVEQAKASSGSGIVGSSLSLVGSIIDAAGNS